MRKFALLLAICAVLGSCSYVGNQRNRAERSIVPSESGSASSTASPSASGSAKSSPSAHATTAGPGATPPSTVKPSSGSVSPSASSTSTPKPMALCYKDFQLFDVVPKSQFHPGETVPITLRGYNKSKNKCAVKLSPCLQVATIVNEWSSHAEGSGCPAPSTRYVQPNDSISVTYNWNQRHCNGVGCSGPQVKSGRGYEAGCKWSIGGQVVYCSTTTFQVLSS